jgi:oligoribonuclease
MVDPTPHPDNLIWIDLEMTGLDPQTDVIIEIASLVTDPQLNILAEGPVLAIHRSDEELDRMDDWCRRTHGASGLTHRVRTSAIDVAEAERLTLEFTAAWIPQGASPLCGNTISHDRRFLRRYMPRFEAYLHYRNIDVSTIKELVRRWYPPERHAPGKKGSHLALDDIRESVEELRYYRDHLFVPPGD